MPRHLDTERKAALLHAASDAILDVGLVGVPLSRIAESCGVSARMLLHYFGSRDALVVAALEEIRRRHLALIEHAIPEGPDFMSDLAEAWTWLAGPDVAPFFALFQQVAAIERVDGRAAHDMTPRLTLDWFPVFVERFRAAGWSDGDAATSATAYVAVVRGLLMDLAATGDVARTSAAYQRFVSWLANDSHLRR